MNTEGFLLEFRPMGPVTKVLATDVESGHAVSIVGSAQATRSELTNLVLQKLKESIEQERAVRDTGS